VIFGLALRVQAGFVWAASTINHKPSAIPDQRVYTLIGDSENAVDKSGQISHAGRHLVTRIHFESF
jgi:hypothetical protein